MIFFSTKKAKVGSGWFGILLSVAAAGTQGCSWALQAESREFWIVRGDGVSGGHGTQESPWLVTSAEDFDQRLRSLPPGCRISLGPGIFPTHGRARWQLKTGQRLLGAGMGRTILRLEKPPPGAPLAVVVGTLNDDAEDIVVQDLTIDCHYQTSWGPITVQGVNLEGSYHTLRRVEVLRAAGFAQECFALGIGAHKRESYGNLIEHCVVREYVGGWCTAIYFVNNSCLHDPHNPAPVFTRGLVRQNFVDLSKGWFPKGGGCAYGGGGMERAIFRENRSLGAVYGFNFDTTRLQNTVLANNTFEFCSYAGIHARSLRPGDRIENLVLIGNTVSLRPLPGQPSAFGISAGGSREAPARGLSVEKNTFSVSSPGGTQIVGLMLFGWDGEIKMIGNTFGPEFRQALEPGARYISQGNQPEIVPPPSQPPARR